MNKQGANGIGWTNFTYNPVTGCENDCFYCYARKIGMRFEGHFKPTFHEDRLEQPYKQKEPSKIFVCSMSDLFGQWVPAEWIDKVIQVARDNPRHIFQFLTKNPKRYTEFDFTENCWLGETSEGDSVWSIKDGIGKNIKFLSLEPLMKPFHLHFIKLYDWIIIGAMSGQGSKEHQPKLEWIEEIAKQASRDNIPVFMKNSLKDIWQGELLKEFPIKPWYPTIQEQVGEFVEGMGEYKKAKEKEKSYIKEGQNLFRRDLRVEKKR